VRVWMRRGAQSEKRRRRGVGEEECGGGYATGAIGSGKRGKRQSRKIVEEVVSGFGRCVHGLRSRRRYRLGPGVIGRVACVGWGRREREFGAPPVVAA
jgi:hypothetical protein